MCLYTVKIVVEKPYREIAISKTIIVSNPVSPGDLISLPGGMEFISGNIDLHSQKFRVIGEEHKTFLYEPLKDPLNAAQPVSELILVFATKSTR